MRPQFLSHYFAILDIKIIFSEIWVLPSGPKSNKVGRYFNLDAKTLDKVIVLQALDAGAKWAVVINKCCCRSIGISCSTKCHA